MLFGANNKSSLLRTSKMSKDQELEESPHNSNMTSKPMKTSGSGKPVSDPKIRSNSSLKGKMNKD